MWYVFHHIKSHGDRNRAVMLTLYNHRGIDDVKNGQSDIPSEPGYGS